MPVFLIFVRTIIRYFWSFLIFVRTIILFLGVFLYVHNSIFACFSIFVRTIIRYFWSFLIFVRTIIGHFFHENYGVLSKNWRFLVQYIELKNWIFLRFFRERPIFVRTKNRVFGRFLRVFGHFVAKSPLFYPFLFYIRSAQNIELRNIKSSISWGVLI